MQSTITTAAAAGPNSVTSARRRVVIIIAAALAAISLGWAGVTAVGAFFTSQATVTGQTVTTATVEISAAIATTSAPIQVSDLLPGDTATTQVTVANTGSAGVYYSVELQVDGTGDVALEDELLVTVSGGGATETRTLSQWQTGYFQWGQALAAGDAGAVTVTVELPTSADNSLQGTSTGFDVRVTAIQERNTPVPTAGWNSH